MNRLRSILLSGLVALLMVGMVVADDTGPADTGDGVERSFIGEYVRGICMDSEKWNCIHFEFTFFWDVPIPF